MVAVLVLLCVLFAVFPLLLLTLLVTAFPWLRLRYVANVATDVANIGVAVVVVVIGMLVTGVGWRWWRRRCRIVVTALLLVTLSIPVTPP